MKQTEAMSPGKKSVHFTGLYEQRSQNTNADFFANRPLVAQLIVGVATADCAPYTAARQCQAFEPELFRHTPGFETIIQPGRRQLRQQPVAKQLPARMAVDAGNVAQRPPQGQPTPSRKKLR